MNIVEKTILNYNYDHVADLICNLKTKHFHINHVDGDKIEINAAKLIDYFDPIHNIKPCDSKIVMEKIVTEQKYFKCIAKTLAAIDINNLCAIEAEDGKLPYERYLPYAYGLIKPDNQNYPENYTEIKLENKDQIIIAHIDNIKYEIKFALNNKVYGPYSLYPFTEAVKTTIWDIPDVKISNNTYSECEKIDLIDIAKSIAIIDENAFFGLTYEDENGQDHEWYEMYLKEAYKLYEIIGRESGWKKLG